MAIAKHVPAQSQGTDVKAAIAEVMKSFGQTMYMQVKVGCAAYIKQKKLEKGQVSDPGMQSIVKILEGLLSAL